MTEGRRGAEEVFDRRYFERLSRARSHWWTEGMQRAGAALLGPARPPAAVLDAGCGSGTSFPLLSRHAGEGRPIHAIDVALGAVEHCRALGYRALVVQASVTAIPYGDRSFDLVVCADVLQHLTPRGAAEALGEIRRVLRPGGRVLLRTNARFGRSHVVEQEDWRMYDPDLLRREIAAAGLVVDRLSYANALPALWARLRGGAGAPPVAGAPGEHHEQVAGLGIPVPGGGARRALGLGLLSLEARWLSRPGRSLPFGHALFAVALRPSPS